MASALSGQSCSTFTKSPLFFNKHIKKQQQLSYLRIRASAADEEDCNVEECAPEKEIKKVSMEWLAGEKTKIAGTFPPCNRG